jgi:hypothetical protein
MQVSTHDNKTMTKAQIIHKRYIQYQLQCLLMQMIPQENIPSDLPSVHQKQSHTGPKKALYKKLSGSHKKQRPIRLFQPTK